MADINELIVDMLPTWELDKSINDYRACAEIAILYNDNKIDIQDVVISYYFDDKEVLSFRDVTGISTGNHQFKVVVTYRGITKVCIKYKEFDIVSIRERSCDEKEEEEQKPNVPFNPIILRKSIPWPTANVKQVYFTNNIYIRKGNIPKDENGYYINISDIVRITKNTPIMYAVYQYNHGMYFSTADIETDVYTKHYLEIRDESYFTGIVINIGMHDVKQQAEHYVYLNTKGKICISKTKPIGLRFNKYPTLHFKDFNKYINAETNVYVEVQYYMNTTKLINNTKCRLKKFAHERSGNFDKEKYMYISDFINMLIAMNVKPNRKLLRARFTNRFIKKKYTVPKRNRKTNSGDWSYFWYSGKKRKYIEITNNKNS